MKTKTILISILPAALPILLLFFTSPRSARGCTSMLVHSDASRTQTPILWKNRDTDFLSNKVLFVRETPYHYIGLANNEDNSGRWIYAGLNSRGFAIANTVAYNLPDPGADIRDLEGAVMADALRVCATVNDFEQWLTRNQGPSLGCQTNFLTMDALGNTVIFETDNRHFKKYNAAETPEKYLVNTNFARSGAAGQGTGYLRFERASLLAQQLKNDGFTVENLLQIMARDFGHVLLNSPSLPDLPQLSDLSPAWVQTGDTINRQYTSAAVVITGKKSPAHVATMWVLLGEPVTGIAVPLWVEAGETPACLRDGLHAPMNAESNRIKSLIRPYGEKDRILYLRASRLDNREKTGFLPRLLQTEREIFAAVETFLQKPHSPREYAAFQEQMALKALETLKSIR